MAARTQDEIRNRFTAVRESGEDFLGFRLEALLDAMTYETAASTGLLKDGVDPGAWTEPDVARTARDYLVFAVGKAVDHRGISASRSVEKLSEWLWVLGEDDLAERFDAAEYAQYGAPKLTVLAETWGVKHDHTDDPGWQRMAQGLPCEPCLARGVALDDIHPAAGYDLSFPAYERVRDGWLAQDLTDWHAARECARAGDYWRRVRPEFVDKLPWPGAGRELTDEDRAECAHEAAMKRQEDV